MNASVRPRHRIFLVDRAFQLKYTWAAVGMGTVSTALTAVVILYPLYTFGILRIPRFLPWPILGGMVVAAVVNIFSIALMGIIITHRVAGPVFGMIRQMRRVAMGHWVGELRTRDNDELQPLVRNLNEMTLALREVALKDHARAVALRERLERSASASGAGLDDAIADLRAWESDILERSGKES